MSQLHVETIEGAGAGRDDPDDIQVHLYRVQMLAVSAGHGNVLFRGPGTNADCHVRTSGIRHQRVGELDANINVLQVDAVAKVSIASPPTYI